MLLSAIGLADIPLANPAKPWKDGRKQGSGVGLASDFKLIFRFRGQVKPDPDQPFLLCKEPRRRCGKVPESPDRRWDTEPPLR